MSLAETTFERRSLRKEIRELTNKYAREVDFGVCWQSVSRPKDGDRACRVSGADVCLGASLEEGGLFDTLTRKFISKEIKDPRPTIYFAESQAVPFSFGKHGSKHNRMIIVGSHGSGKTEVLVRWLLRKCLHLKNCTIGVVAPTVARTKILWNKLKKILMPQWITQERVADKEIHLINGIILEFCSANDGNSQLGSSIAGKDWSACIIDEEQDIAQQSLDEIMMRGRDSSDGYYPVLSTCTLKDSPQFRERMKIYNSQPNCIVYRMTLQDNPFVDQSYIDSLAASLSPRAYRMRVLALDARPEAAVYPDFDRERHIAKLPEIGAFDVTKKITGYSLLAGYDPGAYKDFSVFLKAYRIGNAPVTWWIIDEVETMPGNPEKHAYDLQRKVNRLGYDVSDLIVRADPHGNTPSDNKTDKTVYTIMRNCGIMIKPAQFTQNPKLADGNKAGTIPKEARIGVVNTLLLSAKGETSLYLLSDDKGNPIARQTAESIDVNERNPNTGRAEQYRKDKYDPTHPACALGYGLWPYLKPRRDQASVRLAQG